MRAWILLLFCLVVLAAIANAEKKQDQGKGVERGNPNNGQGKRVKARNGGKRPRLVKKKPQKQGKSRKKACAGNCVATAQDCQGKIKKRGCGPSQVCCLSSKRTVNKRSCAPLKRCNKKNGECRKMSKGCNLDEKRYMNKGKKKYCDNNSCYCCVKQCKAKKRCNKAGGSCMLKKAAKKMCDGEFIKSKKYCKGKKCGCCIPGGSLPESSNCNTERAYCPNCGVAPIDTDGLRVVNGSDASEHEYPYQVFLEAFLGSIPLSCGGSIIKKNWILTAAHCLVDQDGNPINAENVYVRYGSIDVSQAEVVQAKRVIVHENYDHFKFPLEDDIGLVEIKSHLDYESDSSIQPICLAEESDITVGGKAVATGWGALEYGGDMPEVLQEVVLDLISNKECKSKYDVPPDHSKVLCALTANKDTCQGDSGGPLVVQVCQNRWAQVGIVSYGYRCAYPDAPGVYTRVPTYREWIDTQTGSSTSC